MFISEYFDYKGTKNNVSVNKLRHIIITTSVWHSVPERATYGTEYACRAQKGFLGYATHFQKHSV